MGLPVGAFAAPASGGRDLLPREARRRMRMRSRFVQWSSSRSFAPWRLRVHRT